MLIKYVPKGILNSFIEYIKIIYPLLFMIPHQLFIEREGIMHVTTYMVIFPGIPFKEKKAYVLLCFYVLGLQQILALKCWSQAYQHPSASLG